MVVACGGGVGMVVGCVVLLSRLFFFFFTNFDMCVSDIKPENIMIRADGHLQLVSARDRTTSSITTATSIAIIATATTMCFITHDRP